MYLKFTMEIINLGDNIMTYFDRLVSRFNDDGLKSVSMAESTTQIFVGRGVVVTVERSEE